MTKRNDTFNLQVLLLSEDYGKHLMGVEDLIQKHNMLESDIVVYGEQVTNVNNQAAKYMDPNGPDGSGKKVCSRQNVSVSCCRSVFGFLLSLISSSF